MNREKLSCILNRASRAEALSLAARVQQAHEVLIVKPAAKTLVMIPAVESVRDSEFYLGELLATECIVQIGDARGGAVSMGDDFEKTYAVAVMDALYAADPAMMESMLPEILALEEKQTLRRRIEAAISKKTQVRFMIMEDKNEADHAI